MTKKFNLRKYTRNQLIEALTCPVNRHTTRVEKKCDDWDLFHHPDWLISHYIKNGGAKAFAKHREEKEYWIEQEEKHELAEQKKEEAKETGTKESRKTETDSDKASPKDKK